MNNLNQNKAAYSILANGMELITLERSFAPVVSIQCWLRAGSIMENDAANPAGLAHFLEHMTFKGTHTRGVGEISATVEGWGGEINAYTTFDRTVYYLTVAREFAAEAVELLGDAVFQSTIDPAEVERERKVILEEVSRSLDDPGSRAAQKIFARVYAGSEAGRPVIGSPESVAAITREQLRDFRDTHYRPANCGFVIVGDFDSARLTSILEKFSQKFSEKSDEKSGQAAPARAFPSRGLWSATPFHAQIPLVRQPMAVDLVRGDYQQVRFDFAVSAPELEHMDTAALDMCAYMLGGGDLGILNRDLRDARGLVSSAAASLFSPAFPGLFEISIMTGDDTALAAIEAVGETLAGFAFGPWGKADLDRAKSAVRADKIFRDETIDGLARIGFGISTSQKHQYEEILLARIERLEVDDLLGAWQRWIHPENFHIVGVAPDRLTITEQEVEEAFRRGMAKAKPLVTTSAASGTSTTQAPAPASKPRLATSKIKTTETVVKTLKPGLEFIYRQRPGSGLLSLVMATEGGQRAEFGELLMPGIFNAMASNLGRATARSSYEDCAWLIESSGADLAAFSGKDSLGFRLSCLAESHDRLTDLVQEMMLEPHFPLPQFESFQRELLDYFRHQADSPASVCMRRLQNLVLGKHPYGQDLAGVSEQISALTPDHIQAAYHGWLTGGPWVIAGCGDLPVEVVEGLLLKGLADFQPNKTPRKFASDAIISPVSSSRETVAMDRQQVHIGVAMPGPGWSSEDRFSVDVLCNILGGTGGRMFATLRDRDGLAYSVAPILSYGKNRGLIGAYIACSPDKAAAAEAGIWRELEAIAEGGATDAEILRAKSYIKGSHVMELQSGESQATTMALMELYGVGHDSYLKYPGHIDRVEGQDVLRAAHKFLDKNRAQAVLVGL